jgi:hypothetical protein
MKMRFLFFSLAAQKNERQHAMNMLGAWHSTGNRCKAKERLELRCIF